MNLRSQKILQRPRWSKVRALYKSMGYSDEDLGRPLIGIANSWNRLVPEARRLTFLYVKGNEVEVCRWNDDANRIDRVPLFVLTDDLARERCPAPAAVRPVEPVSRTWRR